MSQHILPADLWGRTTMAIVIVSVVVLTIEVGGLPALLVIALATCAALYEWHGLRIPSWPKYQWISLGTVYVGIYVWALISFHNASTSYVYWIMACVSAADVGAYIAGKLCKAFNIKTRKLTSISPNKTWAGVYGGFGAFMLVHIIFSLHGLAPAMAYDLAIAPIAFLISVAGDIAISSLKRALGIKDTGKLLGPHGGIFDRFDSHMPATIFAWIMW